MRRLRLLDVILAGMAVSFVTVQGSAQSLASPPETQRPPSIPVVPPQTPPLIGEPLTLDSPPVHVPVAIPGCGSPRPDGGCPWPAFRAAMEKAIDPKFTDLR